MTFDPNKITFRCEDSTGKTSFHNDLNVYEEIKPGVGVFLLHLQITIVDL